MTHYTDLSPYTYLPQTVPDGVTALAVGWLDGEHPYPTGEVPEKFIGQLGDLCAHHTTARTRGMHWCDLCTEDEADYPVTEHIDTTPVPLGGAEIRVLTPTGDLLAAPDLIYHYIRKHSYLPPEPFIEAVTAHRLASEPSP
jgi:hypothetical protein